MHRASLPALLLLASSLAAQTATYAVFTPLATNPAPAPRERALMAHDEARNRTLLAGGMGPNVLQETWEFNGTAWTHVFPSNQLNFSRPVRLAYSPQRGQIVAVTGEDTSGGSAMVVRAWTGTNWLVLDTNGPLSRAYDYEIAWDANRGVLVMFGGGQTGAETWEWNSTSWTLKGTGGPAARSGHRLVYDEARHVVVLQGGQSQSNFGFTDTWEWNGTYWLERLGITAPATSIQSVIVYDRSHQRVLLYGGSYNGNDVGGVFAYDGTSWTTLPTFGAPASVRQHAAAYDPVSEKVVLFGGVAGPTLLSTRTIEFVTGTIAGSFPHHTGCLGPVGVPSIAAIGTSRPVLGSTFQVHFDNLPNTPLSLVFGAFGTSDQFWETVPLPIDLTPLGFTSCSLFVEPSILQLLSNLSGGATWSIALPSSQSLDGVEFFLQGLVLAQGFNPAGAVLTSSLRGVAGTL